MLNNQLKNRSMRCYLVTFDNIFEHAKFQQNQEKYFVNLDTSQVKINQYNSKFCEIQTMHRNQFFHNLLKQDFPNTKVLLKKHHMGKSTYIIL